MPEDHFREAALRLRAEVERRHARTLGEGTGGSSADPIAFLPLAPEAYRRAEILERVLVEEFTGKTLDELYRVQLADTEYGPVAALLDRRPLDQFPITPEQCRQRLWGALRLLWRVGPVTERKLRALGYRSLPELAHHPRWSGQVGELLQAIQAPDLPGLAVQIGRWYAISHPLSLSLLGLVSPERVIFLDIETLGMATEPVILVGLAWPEEGELVVRQLVVRDIPEELPVLVETARAIAGAEALVTFNGRAFDLNYLASRFAYYGLHAEVDRPNFDLVHFARRRWRDELPDCRLETLESHVLGVERPLDVPSAMVPEFYVTYLAEGNVGPLAAVIEHNRQDLVSMVSLLSRLWEELMG
ncbi:MAG: ribonuclease H-like domain-containing protein [Candidatus Bipolaricaulaceae bacterium]